MKKRLLLSIMLTGLLLCTSIVYADEEQSGKPVQKNEQAFNEADYNLVSESGAIQILKQGEKYALYNKETKKFIIKPIIDDIKLLDEKVPNIYKIYIDGNVGYIDLETDTKIITQFDDIKLFHEFIKIKKGQKYGLMNRKADLIIPAKYDKVNIISNSEERFISVKDGLKYKIFSLDGKEISDENLYKVNVKESEYTDLVEDIKPEIINYIKAQKTEELKELGENIHSAVVEKNVQESELALNDNTPPETSSVSYGNLQFYVVKKNNKIGLNDINGMEIAPMKFDKIDIDTPCKHFSDPIVICKNDKEAAIYSIKGKKLAYMKDKVIHVFWNRRSYKYIPVSDIIWDVKLDKKQLGRLVQEEEKYRYKKIGFSILPMHKPNELFLSILSI